MKNTFTVSDQEKLRILNLHESYREWSGSLITEQTEKIYDKYDTGYDYKVSNGKWVASKKGQNKWFSLEKYPTAIQKLDTTYSDARTTKSSPTTKPNRLPLPFKSKEEGDRFRVWMNKYYPKTSKSLDLDKSGPFDNSYIKRAWNHEGGDGLKSEIYTKKVLSKDDGTNDIYVSDTINPIFSQQIDFNNLKIGDTTNKICKPNDEKCAQFVNNFTDKFDAVGNAWNAYRNDTRLGPTIYSKFKGLDKSKQDEAIKLWQQIHKAGGAVEGSNITDGEVKKFIKGLVGSGVNTDLQLDDIVGIYHNPSSHHEEAFYHGGKPWFVNGEPGNTIRRGNAWGMNTHVGIVGVIKDGVPLIFHNVGGNVKSDPVENLKIAWVKRKGGTKPVKV